MLSQNETTMNVTTRLKTCFLTVDAETECMRKGVGVISDIRNEVAHDEGMHIPIVWFIRFQHSWHDSLNWTGPNQIQDGDKDMMDGFSLLGDIQADLLDSGDEFGWHYHAYNYVYRNDLPEKQRLLILKRDLEVCHTALTKYCDMPIVSFRSGWFLIPHQSVFETLFNVGMRIDSSTSLQSDRARALSQIHADLSVHYQSPIVTTIDKNFGLDMVPVYDEPSDMPFYVELKHDYEFVRHNWSWRRQNFRQTRKNILDFKTKLHKLARHLKRNNGHFMTFKQYFYPAISVAKHREQNEQLLETS